MDLLKLQYFLCVASSASMEEAAGMLNVSQSTLSMAVKKLEEELGVALFRRSGRRKELTAQGRRSRRRPPPFWCTRKTSASRCASFRTAPPAR